MTGTSTYRLTRGRKFLNGAWREAGDIVTLTEEQALNLRLSIEPVSEIPHLDDVVAEELANRAQFKTTLAEPSSDQDTDSASSVADESASSVVDEYEEEWLDSDDEE